MTSCQLLKTKKRIVVVADGRLSRDDNTVSFNSAKKIITFQPRYRYPIIVMNNFSSFCDYTGPIWFVAYAGTYALSKEVLDNFINRVTNLYLKRDNRGVPTLDDNFDRDDLFSNSYNFKQDEKPSFQGNFIRDELTRALYDKASEWSVNRGFPDCEFLLFGEDQVTRDYIAYRLCIDGINYRQGNPICTQVEEVEDGNLTTIGSRSVAGSVFADESLINGIKGWKDPDLDDMWKDFPWKLEDGQERVKKVPSDVWSCDDVAERISRIIRETADSSVGGNILVATGFPGRRISLVSTADESK